MHGFLFAHALTIRPAIIWPFWKNGRATVVVMPGIWFLVATGSGPQFAEMQTTLIPAASACLITGVSAPPSFGVITNASYCFDVIASWSWVTWVAAVKSFESKTLETTPPYSFAPFCRPVSWAFW